jgi:hypothetical protein
MCKPQALSLTAAIRLCESSFLKRDVEILSVCERESIITVEDLLTVRYILHNLFNDTQVAVLYAFFVEIGYTLEQLSLTETKA